jgi:hypothetical protein
MKQEKKYDGYGGCLLLFIAFIVAIAILSCGKQVAAAPPQYKFDKYEMIVDWYDLDTTHRRTMYRQVFDSIYKESTRLAFDTLPDMWYIDCSMLNVLQQLYYKKNGVKIQPSKFPIEEQGAK